MSSSVRSSLSKSLRGDVLLLTLENPGGYPRLERTILMQLMQEIRLANSDSAISGVVLTGTESSFASGAEIDEIAELTPLAGREFALLGQRLMTQIEGSTKPIVAAIRGVCFGGGLDLALACEKRIAAEDARFAHPGGTLGLLTGWGGTQRLPRRLGRARALEILSTGRVITAREALAMGLVDQIRSVEELVSSAIALASRQSV